MIIWITGISGSGKTTIAHQLRNVFKRKIKNIVNIDGDIIRELFGNDLKYDLKSRILQIKRIQKLSLFLEKQNLIVLVSALYCNDSLMRWNRENFKNYYEIYLEASLDTVKSRDVKKLYRNYERGLEKNIVGIDIPWIPPKKFDLKISMDKNISITETIDIIIKKLDYLNDI